MPSSRVDAMPAALSLTHQHILAVVESELAGRSPGGRLSLLDAGCGDGLLLGYLARALPILRPGAELDLHGFDVGDHGVQQAGYFDRTIADLDAATGVSWRERLALISERDPWPYADASLDAVVSNQVLEHVADHGRFFAETARVLRPGGVSVHLFPLGHVAVEPHLHVPFAHWFGGSDAIADAIRWSNRLGIGRFRAAAETDLDRYARAHADFLVRFTNYRTMATLIAEAKRAKLHATFRYTPHYYTAKLRAMAGKPARYRYAVPGALHGLAAMALRYVSSATLVLRKDESYSLPALHPEPVP
ncbi:MULTISPECIES: class I SAM-dependent methyltransferase [Methylobacterium]|nr:MULTISPECIES: class I SAM-dependent methyltransferase [Methylobacterium]